MLQSILILVLSLILYSCNEENPPKEKADTQTNESQQDNGNDSDTSMTDAELFSSALVQDILNADDEIDLQFYLEDEIYPLVSKSSKVTLDRVSSSLYLLSFDDNGVVKNILIQKFYNPDNDEFVFEKNEIETDALKQFIK